MHSKYLKSKLVQPEPDGCVQCYLEWFLYQQDQLCIRKTEGVEVISLQLLMLPSYWPDPEQH